MTRFAILGLISKQPMSGFDIKKAVDQGIGYFWNESYGQLYPILKTLAAEGLVEMAIEQTSGKPDRHVYSITSTGLQELRSWLMRPVEAQRVRNTLLLRLFFGDNVPTTVSIQQIEGVCNFSRGLLAQFEQLEPIFKQRPAFEYITLMFGMTYHKTIVEWGEQAIQLLQQQPSTKSNKKQRSGRKS